MGGNFKDLLVWQKAIGLAKQIYHITAAFPREEQFGLTNQMRRSVVSISANIAEGHGRRSIPSFKQFLNISLGSASELETLLLLSVELKFLEAEAGSELILQCDEIQKMIYGLIASFSKKVG